MRRMLIVKSEPYYSTKTQRGTGLRKEPIRVGSDTYRYWTNAVERHGENARVNCHRKWYTIVDAEVSKEPGYVDFYLKPVE